MLELAEWFLQDLGIWQFDGNKVVTVEYGILDIFQMKQTQIYVCILVEFILVEIWVHYCISWN